MIQVCSIEHYTVYLAVCFKYEDQIKIKIRFICHAYIRNLSHPGWHLLKHTLIETDAIHWSGGHSQHPGSMGVRCLAQGHLSSDKEVNCPPSSCQFTNLLSGESGDRQPSGYWTTHTHHWATAAQVDHECLLWMTSHPAHSNVNILTVWLIMYEALN